MSSNLNILPNKSWHVWKFENRAKVERDERLHKEKAAEEDKRRLELDAQGRYDRLKHKKPKDNYPLISSFEKNQLHTHRKDPRRPKSGVPLKKEKRSDKSKDHQAKNGYSLIRQRYSKSRFEKITESHNDVYSQTTPEQKKTEKKKKKRKRKRKRRRKKTDGKKRKRELHEDCDEYSPSKKKLKLDDDDEIISMEELRKERLEREAKEREKKLKFLDSHL